MKFLERMLTQFFWRHIPDSTDAKPRFIKNTSIAVTSTQTVSAATLRLPSCSSTVGAGGVAGAGAVSGGAASVLAASLDCSSWARPAAAVPSTNRVTTKPTPNHLQSDKIRAMALTRFQKDFENITGPEGLASPVAQKGRVDSAKPVVGRQVKAI